MYRLLERLLEISLMFEDMIDTLLGAHGNLLLLVGGGVQYRVGIERRDKDGFKSGVRPENTQIQLF